MLDKLIETLAAYESAISAAVGLLTLCAALWAALRLTLLRKAGAAAEARSADAARMRRGGSLSPLLNLGLGRHSRLEQLVSVRSVNVVLLGLGATSLVWFAVSLSSDATVLLSALNLFVFVCVLFAFALQWSEHTGAARWVLVLAVNVYTLGCTLAAGPMHGTEYFIAGVLAVAVLVFGRAELGQMLLALLVSLLFAVASLVASRVMPPMLSMSEAMLSSGYYANAVILAAITYAAVSFYRRFAASSYLELAAQKQRTESLASSLFPPRVLRRFQETGEAVADWHPEAMVLYVSIGGFSALHQRVPAVDLVARLAELFASFDAITQEQGLDKVKTLGTSYVAATGISSSVPDNGALADAALAMREALRAFADEVAWPLSFRGGLATGITISGVIAGARPRYDVWGEALEEATRIAQQVDAGDIAVNEAGYWRLTATHALDRLPGEPSRYRLCGDEPAPTSAHG
ncbi:MAG: adenylate/guanylate cyclase domain-containing protein [Halieaceae bacterium]|jgi:class 3 adenylate cyclase|nr:adenylate/guanylate cyclase domain-containing protein [Halieaceae bacterium]